MQFYEKYVSLCNSINKSPSAVAEELGLTPAAATGWGQGAKPRKATIQKIADYFGVSVDDLKADENHPADGEVVEERVTPAEQYLLRLFRLVPKEQQETVLMGVELTLRSQGLLK